MRLEWLDEASESYAEIIDYIADRNPKGARAIAALIDQTVERIVNNPYLYRPGRVPNTREAVAHPNYLVIYRVELTAVVIVAVLHARQQYP